MSRHVDTVSAADDERRRLREDGPTPTIERRIAEIEARLDAHGGYTGVSCVWCNEATWLITSLRSSLSENAALRQVDSETVSRVVSAARAYAEYTMQDSDDTAATFRACDAIVAAFRGAATDTEHAP